MKTIFKIIILICIGVNVVSFRLHALDSVDSTVSYLKSKGLDVELDNTSKSYEIDCRKGSIVSNEDFKYLNRLGKIRLLRIDSNMITDVGIQYLENLASVEVLSFATAKISDMGMRHLRNLQKVRILDLSKTNITDEGLKIISQFSNLEDLTLNNVKITNKGIQYLVNLENLRGLELNGNLIDDGCIETLGKMKSEAISEIGIRGTRITKDGAKKLKKLLPGCTVFHK